MSADFEKNNKIYEQVKKQLQSENPMHAFVFAGGSAEDRMALASRIADDVLCGRKEDYIPVEKEADKASLGVKPIEGLTEKLSLKPFGVSYAVVIREGNLMTQEAQNKLLKTLEEPVSPAVIMLLTENKDALLGTILSRCAVYQLAEPELDVSEEISKIAESVAQLAAAGAPFYKKKAAVMPLFADKDKQRANSLSFLDALEKNVLERTKAEDAKLIDAAPKIHAARTALKLTHNVSYTVKQLCLQI